MLTKLLDKIKLKYNNYKEIKEYGAITYKSFDKTSDDIVNRFLSSRVIDKYTYDGYDLKLFSNNIYLELWAANGLISLASSVKLLRNWKSSSNKDLPSELEVSSNNQDNKFGYAECLFKSNDISLSYSTLNKIKPIYLKAKSEYELIQSNKENVRIESIMNAIDGTEEIKVES